MKKLFVSFLFLAICLSAAAQSDSDSDTTAVRKKWYVDVNGGAQVFTGMTDKYLPFKEAVAPVGGISFGRYINDWLNIDLNASAAQFKGLYTRPIVEKHFATEDCFDLNSQRYYQKGAYLQLYARAGLDINTIIAGYDEDRTLSFVPYAGVGIASGIGKNAVEVSNFAIVPTIDYGLELLVKLSSVCTGVVDLHGNAVGVKLDNEGCSVHTFHASYGAKLGVRFSFGN